MLLELFIGSIQNPTGSQHSLRVPQAGLPKVDDDIVYKKIKILLIAAGNVDNEDESNNTQFLPNCVRIRRCLHFFIENAPPLTRWAWSLILPLLEWYCFCGSIFPCSIWMSRHCRRTVLVIVRRWSLNSRVLEQDRQHVVYETPIRFCVSPSLNRFQEHVVTSAIIALDHHGRRKCL